MKNGQKLLKELGELRPHSVYFRTHNLLTTGDGTPALKWGSTNAYTEDPNGNPIYDWTIVDRIFDTYLQRGLKPYVQIGFMPKALSMSRTLPAPLDIDSKVRRDFHRLGLSSERLFQMGRASLSVDKALC